LSTSCVPSSESSPFSSFSSAAAASTAQFLTNLPRIRNQILRKSTRERGERKRNHTNDEKKSENRREIGTHTSHKGRQEHERQEQKKERLPPPPPTAEPRDERIFFFRDLGLERDRDRENKRQKQQQQLAGKRTGYTENGFGRTWFQ
jgi:hypothetical protein